MAKAKKLPSGSWRAQVFDFKDVDGKNHYKSFTAQSRRQAEFLVAEYASGKAEELPENITLYAAVTKYIEVTARSIIAQYNQGIRRTPQELLPGYRNH